MDFLNLLCGHKTRTTKNRLTTTNNLPTTTTTNLLHTLETLETLETCMPANFPDTGVFETPVSRDVAR